MKAKSGSSIGGLVFGIILATLLGHYWPRADSLLISAMWWWLIIFGILLVISIVVIVIAALAKS